MEGIVFYKSHKEAGIKIHLEVHQVEGSCRSKKHIALTLANLCSGLEIKGVETILQDPGKTNPKATGADRRRSVKPLFLKELEDQGVIAQLYRQ